MTMNWSNSSTYSYGGGLSEFQLLSIMKLLNTATTDQLRTIKNACETKIKNETSPYSYSNL